MNYGKTKPASAIITAIILTIIALLIIDIHYKTVVVDVPKFDHKIPAALVQSKSATSPNSQFIIPTSLLLSVPFTSQAPAGNWDQEHNEDCEEAGAIMAAAYFENLDDQHPGGDHEPTLSPTLVDNALSALTSWENQNFGYNLDTTSHETARMISQVYGLQTKLIDNFSEADIKNELAQNHVVIISEYGRALGNPYYKAPGPIHHMLVIKGYDGDNFVTNDSGTRRGQNYLYTFDIIQKAAADWDHQTNNVDLNKKIVISVWK